MAGKYKQPSCSGNAKSQTFFIRASINGKKDVMVAEFNTYSIWVKILFGTLL